MDLSDYEPHELTPRVLDELCKEAFGKEMKDFKDVLLVLERFRRDLELLEIQRFAGMINHTKEKELLDCAYVRKCLILLLMKSEDFNSLMDKIKIFSARV